MAVNTDDTNDGLTIPAVDQHLRITRKIGSTRRKIITLGIDVALATCAGYFFAHFANLELSRSEASFVFALILGLYIAGLYDDFYPEDLSSSIAAYLLAMLATETSIAIVALFEKNISQLAGYSLLNVTTVVLLAVWRFNFHKLSAETLERTPTILIGDGAEYEAGVNAVRNAPELLLVGEIKSADPDTWEDAVEEILSSRRAENSLVVIGAGKHLSDKHSSTILRLRRNGAEIATVIQLIEGTEDRVPISLLHSDTLDTWTAITQVGHISSLRVKRVMDIAGAIILTVILALPTLIAMIATKLSDGEKAIYQQQRVGRGGHCFNIYKVRTMVKDAEKDTGAVWSTANDSRITKLGIFLRKTRIDEVPQIYNVLRGEMSLVGPRPERPEFTDSLAEQIPLYDARHSVKPGLTGWAQVKLPYGSSVADTKLKLEYDLYYIKHWSIWLDLRILIKTIGVVLLRKGGR